MKTIIKTTLLTILVICTITPLANITLAISPEMQKAIDVSNKVEAKKRVYDNIVLSYKEQIGKITNLYISKNKEERLIELYNDILDKVSDLRSNMKNSTSIYKGILIETLNELEDITGDEIVIVENSYYAKQDAVKYGDDIEIGETQEEKDEIIEEVVTSSSASNVANVQQESQNRKTLEANGISHKEATAIAWKTDLWDGFEFCANFPAEVYTNNALRHYTDAQSSVADEHKEFIGIYYKNYYTDPVAHRSGARIWQCVRQMYLYYKNQWLTKSDVETIYEKYYGEYVPYTTPFYLEGVQPEDIEEYIENHHNS